ncbi:MAG: J domain-containing protein [Nannocystaceae bacterium]
MHYVKLKLGGILDFIVGAEFVLLHADVIGGPPNRYMVDRLRRDRGALPVGSVQAFSLADAPAPLREHLAPELRRLGLSDLWVPTGYYLFHRGVLIGHRATRPPETWRDLRPFAVVAGIAVVERLVTKRWGLAARFLPHAFEIIVGFLPGEDLSAMLREAASRAGAGPGSSRRPGETRGRAQEPSDPLWSSDPYEVLGVSRGAADEEIKREYRRLTLQHHPDKAASEAERIDREVRQKQINLAYESIRKERGR